MSLKLIDQFNKPQKISEVFTHTFTVGKRGIYLIEITASAKSHQQNHSRNKFQDDGLTAQIDNHVFDQQPAMWNGNDLKNLQKTVAFIIYLDKGDHSIRLIPQQKPFLNLLTIFSVENENISYTPTTNNPAQEGNCRPWYSYMIVNLGLKKISLQAKAKKQFFSFDDDDLQLKIDDKIIKNNDSKVPYWHRDWYWCGKVLKGKSKDFFQESNLTEGIHFIELNADRTPLIEKIFFDVELKSPPPSSSKHYPTKDDPLWTGDFNDDSEEMILARVIFGEARGISKKAKVAVAWTVRNRMNDKDHRWASTYHGVILKPKQYSAFNEDDENLPFVQNPLHSGLSLDKKRWLESYEIAQKVIKGEIKDPTAGANHYYSDYINPPGWTKKKEAKFKIKIDNMYFYDLEKDDNSGKIKLSLLVILGSFLFIMTILTVINVFSAENECTEYSTNEYSEVKDKYYFIHPTWKELVVINFGQEGEFINMKKLTDDGYEKSQVNVFSERDFLGYFQELHKPNDTYDDEDEESRKQYFDNYTALMIIKNGENPYEVYRGDYHTSDWEWFSYKQVRVTKSCGSGCHLVKTINIETKEVEDENVVFFTTQTNN